MPYHSHIDKLIHPFPLDCTSLSILKLNTSFFVYFIGSIGNLKINLILNYLAAIKLIFHYYFILSTLFIILYLILYSPYT
mgnify:CR=1 FL=1